MAQQPHLSILGMIERSEMVPMLNKKELEQITDALDFYADDDLHLSSNCLYLQGIKSKVEAMIRLMQDGDRLALLGDSNEDL